MAAKKRRSHPNKRRTMRPRNEGREAFAEPYCATNSRDVEDVQARPNTPRFTFAPSRRPDTKRVWISARADIGLKWVFWFLGFLGVTAAFGPALLALDPGKSVFQFNCQNWARSSGLPAKEINAIAQSSDGYIWLAGQIGLIRFDGKDFKAFRIGADRSGGLPVNAISSAKDGRLWVSFSEGGVGSFNGTTFNAANDVYGNGSGTRANLVLAASDGAIWTGAPAGWGRWMEGKPADTFFRGTRQSVTSLSEDATGRIWIGTAGDGLSYWAGGELRSFPDRAPQEASALSVVTDLKGDIWVATTRGLYRYDSRFGRKDVLLTGSRVNALLVDSHGSVWIGTDEMGLGRYQDGKLTLLRKSDGLGSDSVTAIIEDTEGSLWIGTREGLSQLTDLKFPIFSGKEGFIPASALAVSASVNGDLWIATTRGATRFDGHTATNFYDSALLPNNFLRRVFAAKNGDAYFSDAARNISVLSGNRPATVYSNFNWTEAFAEDETSVLVGIGPRLERFEDGQIKPYQFAGDAPVLDWINSLFVSSTGAIWAGTNHGLVWIKDGKFRQWTTSEGLTSDRVDAVTEDSDGSIWAVLPMGLVRLKDNKLTPIGEGDGLSDARIFAVIPDNRGYLWVDSSHGLLRISRQSVNDFADGKTRRVDCQIFDDVESIKFTDRDDQALSGCRTTDGRIWFPGPHGVIMVDPPNYFRNRVPPRVAINRIMAAGEELTDRHNSEVRADDRGVEFFFSALSYIAPKKVRVRYQLENFDTTWIEAGPNRSVTYSHLKPGPYVFRVQAANGDGVWNMAGDTFNLELSPPIYQRLWFYALCAVLAAAAAFRLYGWKARQLRARQKELQSQNNLLEAKVAQRTDELARSLSLLNATLESTPDGILAIQMSDDAASWNSQFVEMWGIPEPILRRKAGAPIIAFMAERVRDKAGFVRRIEASQAAPDVESFDAVELKDRRKLEGFCKPQHLEGRSTGIVLHFRDVTERRKIEDALSASEQRFKAMFEQAAVGVAQIDVETGLFAQINAHFCEIMGRTQHEMEQLRLVDIIHPQDIAFYVAKLKRIRSGASRESTQEGRYLRKDGSEVWVSMTVSAMWRAGEKPSFVIAVAQDISGRKQLEEQLRQSQKMDAIGTLAGGIAHDFNNILTMINGYTELAQLELNGNPEVREYLGEVRVAASRATDLVRQILTFSRQQPLERRPISLLPVVTETLKLLRATIPSTIEFKQTFASDVPTVLADATQIHQIVMNLGTNAWYAMKDRAGSLEVRLDRCVVDAAYASMQPRLQPGVYARMCVGDTGCGMDAATLGRIFEPFFTTKPPGEGTGLGLAVVHGIMDNHDGVITAVSQPNKGTVFQLYFPEYVGEAVGDAGHETSVPHGHGERILLVDDEELLVKLGRLALIKLGYEVETATRPEAALEMVRADGPRFALVITDQTMPGMTGVALARQLKEIRPDLPILLMTGNNLSLRSETVKAAGISQVLIKPTSLYALGSATREALDLARARSRGILAGDAPEAPPSPGQGASMREPQPH
jgi:PAS domain S-box-containing protein